MNIETKEMLEQAGICPDDAIRRFSGNEALFLRFLSKFLKDASFEEIRSALKSGDYEAAFRAAHTLKGVSGNLGVKNVFDADSVLVEALRSGRTEDCWALFEKLEECYQKACAAISQLQA